MPPAAGATPPAHGKHEALRSTIVVVAALVVLVGFVAYVTGVFPVCPPPRSRSTSKRNRQDRAGVRPTTHCLGPAGCPRRPGHPRKGRTGPDRHRPGPQTDAAARPVRIDRTRSHAAVSHPRALHSRRSHEDRRGPRTNPRTPYGPAREGTPVAWYNPWDIDVGLGREWRNGDVVHTGQLLALFYSIDVGNKKNDLVDALAQLQLDLDILDASQKAYDRAALSLLDLLAAERAVRGDFNAINRAENTLRAGWFRRRTSRPCVRRPPRSSGSANRRREPAPRSIAIRNSLRSN